MFQAVETSAKKLGKETYAMSVAFEEFHCDHYGHYYGFAYFLARTGEMERPCTLSRQRKRAGASLYRQMLDAWLQFGRPPELFETQVIELVGKR